MKRLVSIFMTLAIIFTSAFAEFPLTAVTVQATISFTPRTSEPSTTNKYWLHTSVGGLNECLLIGNGSVLPNCVGYAWGRAYEILGSRPNLCKGDAGTWYNYNKNNGYYSYGSTPKLGAIACWSGHVAVVEGINSNTSVTFSESNYGGARFRYFTANPNTYCSSLGQTFQGYIYIGEFGNDVKYTDITADTYYFVNKGTGKALNLENNVDANKTNIHMYDLSIGYPSQQMVVSMRSSTDKSYKIRPTASSRLVQSFGDTGVTTSGMNVNIYDDVNDNTQWWHFQSVSGGYVIRNAANTSCVLTAASGHGNVSVSTYTGSNNQIWTLQPVNQKYTIAYNANGGSGTMANTQMTVGTAANLRANTFTRTGYTFLGWSTSSSATTAMYTDKQSVKDLAKSGTVTLYAVWRDDTTHPDSMGYNATSTSITQFWTPVQTADSITVTIKLDNVTLKSVTLPPSSTSYTFTDLKPGTKYEIQIMADYDYVSKGISSYVTTIPPSVSNFNGTSTTNSVNLTWNKSSGATIYKLQQQINDTWQTIASPTGTGYTVSGLKSGTVYNFRIFARNSAGQSAQTKLTISTAIGTPTAVTGFTGTPTSNSITLKWNKSTGATEYKLQQSVNGAWQTIASPTGTTYTVSGLRASTTYNFRIFARKGSTQSAQTKLTITTKDRIAAVSGFTGTPTANSILLEWHHMGVSTSFKLQQNINGAWQTIAEPTGLSYNVTGLQANTTYNFRIFARYGSLQSDQTKLTVSTTAAVPSTVTGFTGTATANSITLKWNKSAGATSYKLQQNVNGAWTTIASPTGTTYTVTGLKANTQYNFRIFPRNNVGQGAQTKLTVSTVGTPETVMGFMGVASSNSITLKWYESANATEYKLQQMINGSWQTIATPTGTSFTVKNLSVNTAYNFRIFARNGSLQSDQVKLTVKTS